MQCIGCSKFYTPASYSFDKNHMDLCPSCMSASNGQSYINSKEWTGQDVSSGFTIFTPKDTDNKS
jgi:hypothetical protein